jgi:hypothetical protein
MKKVGKAILPVLAPTAVRSLGEIVLWLEAVGKTGKWQLTGEQKREMAVIWGKGISEADETTLRLTVEYLKKALVDLQMELEDVGGDTDAEGVGFDISELEEDPEP